MKNVKKILALVLVAVMMMALSVSAFAASITINPGSDATGTVSTQYTYYQLLRASINGDAVSYYLTDGTDDTLRTLLDAVTVDGADLFTFTKSADGTQWIAKINKKADNTDYTDSDGEKIATALATDAIKAAAIATDDFSQSGGSAVADNLDKGYYLVTSTLGTKLVLQTLNEVEIDTKNSYPSTGKEASTSDMEVGDKVTYTITVTIPASTKVGEEFTVHDTLDEHLAILNSSDAIAASAADYNITATDANGNVVTLSDGTKKAATETFAKKFTVSAENITAGSVKITYKAELLSTAADDHGYVNDAFTNTSSYETLPDNVPVYTFDIDVDKSFSGITGDDAANYSATFELRTTASDATTAINFISDTTGYVKADSDDTGASKDLVINGKDIKNIRGLKEGTYYLVETATASGFNLLTDPITVTITDTTDLTAATISPSHTVAYSFGNTSGNGTIEVENNSGTALPSTGGIGTTIFYVVGALLVVGAGVVLVTRRKVDADK